MKPMFGYVAGLGLIAVWVVLAFVMAIPSGWVHVPLALGVTCIAVAIIETPPAYDKPPSES
jgi:1,4-dihydroxy-2-naphthoate octaprenyltransferase